MTSQTINLTAGAVEYTFSRTITAQPKADGAAVDISADTIMMSLGTALAPGSWRTADLVGHPATNTAVAQLLIGAAYKPTAGTYRVWVKIADSPEIVPRCTDGVLTIR